MECALAIQRGMARRNLGACRRQRRILLRAGLDRRDVIADEGRPRPATRSRSPASLRDLVEPRRSVHLGHRVPGGAQAGQGRLRGRLGIHRIGGAAAQPVRAIRGAARAGRRAKTPARRLVALATAPRPDAARCLALAQRAFADLAAARARGVSASGSIRRSSSAKVPAASARRNAAGKSAVRSTTSPWPP